MENSTYIFTDDTKNYWKSNEFIFATKWFKQSFEMVKRKQVGIQKFKVRSYMFWCKNLDHCSVQLYADDTEITCKSSVNDLGVVINNNLKRDSHINQPLSKAQQKLFSLRETFPFLQIREKK